MFFFLDDTQRLFNFTLTYQIETIVTCPVAICLYKIASPFHKTLLATGRLHCGHGFNLKGDRFR